MDSFELPAHDVEKTMKNFPGVEKKQYYTLDEIKEGDSGFGEGRLGAGGMTETDADTSGKMDGPYTKINKKKGEWGHAPKNKLSATEDMYPDEKSLGKIKNPFAW